MSLNKIEEILEFLKEKTPHIEYRTKKIFKYEDQNILIHDDKDSKYFFLGKSVSIYIGYLQDRDTPKESLHSLDIDNSWVFIPHNLKGYALNFGNPRFPNRYYVHGKQISEADFDIILSKQSLKSKIKEISDV